MRLPVVYLSLLGLTIAMVGNTIAWVPAYAEDAPSPEATLPPPQLVEQLGDASYLKRERARLELERREFDAQDALEVGVKSDDLEVSYLCEQLLIDIREKATQRHLAKFVNETDKDKHYDFPAWKALKELLGDDPTVRQMYVDMYRDEPDLLKSLATEKEDIAGKATARALVVQRNINSFRMPITVGSIATMLLVGGQDDVTLPVNGNSIIYSFCYQQVFRDSFNSPTQGPALRKLLGKFMLKADDNSAYQGLTLAMQFGMKEEGLRTATRVLEGKATAAHVKQYAMMTVAKLGDSEHMKLLEPLMEDATVCSQQQVNKVIYKTQVRDIALFALVHIAKEDPKQYGFDRFSPNPQIVANVHTLGFENDEKRAAAFGSWKKFQEAQKAKAGK
ncbi:MAG TPA: hypothetical protein VL096_19905 [Pirellulaceae bacterium]|nr:hypothetical protein [Pirellulaceae bacterium]